MTSTSIYQDIAARTGGGILLGVVGPVRTGKSTFIKRFMDTLVLPNMEDDALRERTVDELPQSAAGRTIMTTEPKFIPETAVHITIDKSAGMDVRLIDCVGYIVPSALGYIENEAPRMVKTPWFEEEVPFNLAAEIGTQKVITEHSTIGLLVTTDGSIGDIPREEYAEAERRIVSELQTINKPFAVLLNTTDPQSASVQQLAARLEEEYGVPVCPVSSLTGEGLDALQSFLQPGKTAALLGSSGAGKSSLINALAGETLMKTGAVREEDARGRHTTTHRQMLRLPGGALVIDTPGMRELGMWDVTEGLGDAFGDVTRLAGGCRFSDCQHESEPGCAVRAAIERGELPEIRLIQYRKLKKEARYSDDPNAYIRQRTEERKRRMVEEHKKVNYKKKR